MTHGFDAFEASLLAGLKFVHHTGRALSNTARTGLWAWAKIAADEVANDGITINSACPGLHDTERIRALGHTGARIGDPADFGRVVAFLCSQPANFINGAALLVDGGAYHGLH